VVEVVVLEAGPAGGQVDPSISSRPPSMGMARVLPPLPAHLQAASSGGALERGHAQGHRFAFPDAGHTEGGHQGQVPLGPGVAPSGVGLGRRGQQASGGVGIADGTGAPSTRRGLGTAAMGLPCTRSSATKKSKNRDHDEWARSTDAASWSVAQEAKAARSASLVRSGGGLLSRQRMMDITGVRRPTRRDVQ
jgi:hypothetical protein